MQPALAEVRKQNAEQTMLYIETARTFLAKSVAEHGLSESDLAAITGLAQPTIRAALFGKGTRPNSYTIGAIAAAIGVHVNVPKNGIDVRAPRKKGPSQRA